MNGKQYTYIQETAKCSYTHHLVTVEIFTCSSQTLNQGNDKGPAQIWEPVSNNYKHGNGIKFEVISEKLNSWKLKLSKAEKTISCHICKYSTTHGKTLVSAILFILSFYQYALWHPSFPKPNCFE
jgi:hypothetical protein